MAVILEVLHPNGVRAWQRLDALPLSVGRGLGNDLILDDPYVDARHAVIALDDAGALRIEDLGSVNGLVMNDARAQGAIPLQLGTEVRLGRTTLRFRDSEEAVAPALVDDRNGRAPIHGGESHASPLELPSRWTTTKSGRLIICATALAAFALSSWLGSTDRTSVTTAVSAASAFAAMAALWAGVWAVASRAIVQRFNYLGHFTVVAAVALVGLVWSTAEEWLAFWFPDAALVEVLSTVFIVAVFCALIAGHLSLSSTMSRARRWRLGILIAGSAVAIGGLAAVATEDTFTDVPTFSGVLKPVAPRWIPTATVGEFGDVMKELKDDVDEMTKK